MYTFGHIFHLLIVRLRMWRKFIRQRFIEATITAPLNAIITLTVYKSSIVFILLYFNGRKFREKKVSRFRGFCQNRESLFREIFQNPSSAKVYFRENSSRFFNSQTIFVFVLFRLLKGHSTFFTPANRDIPQEIWKLM